ncbi:hypothetical protein Y886_31540 [Xanthomonas hyacinthi DSM 19077]|nr:hypothetical protein Y886_31540 [Xanthomonas hyacinthi DSM 19077]
MPRRRSGRCGIRVIGDQDDRTAAYVGVANQVGSHVDRLARVIAGHRHGVGGERGQKVVDAMRIRRQWCHGEGLTGVRDQGVHAIAIRSIEFAHLVTCTTESVRDDVVGKHVRRHRDDHDLRGALGEELLRLPIPGRTGKGQHGECRGDDEGNDRCARRPGLAVEQMRKQQGVR